MRSCLPPVIRSNNFVPTALDHQFLRHIETSSAHSSKASAFDRNDGKPLTSPHLVSSNDLQGPKTNCTSAKLSAALTYMQKSRVAHTIKDLEKHLPCVAQINGMQVKGTMECSR